MRILAPTSVLLLFCSPLNAARQLATVCVPVANLRSDLSVPRASLSDNKQETQLLFGERVEVMASSGAWKRIAAINQMEYSHNKRWEGYPGWILSKELCTALLPSNATLRDRWSTVLDEPGGEMILRLPMGSEVRVLQQKKDAVEIDLLNGKTGWIAQPSIRRLTDPLPQNLREEILLSGRQLLGDYYVWGGRSPKDSLGDVKLSGVDCSGLVHLSLTLNGIRAPRDAYEQWMKAKPLKRDALQPADLIFSAPIKTPKKVTHVAFFTGNEMLLEAPQTGMPVREISFREKFGKDLSQIESGDTVGERVIYFGRLVP